MRSSCRIELGERDGVEGEGGGAVGAEAGEGAGPSSESIIKFGGWAGELGIDLGVNQRADGPHSQLNQGPQGLVLAECFR